MVYLGVRTPSTKCPWKRYRVVAATPINIYLIKLNNNYRGPLHARIKDKVQFESLLRDRNRMDQDPRYLLI
jgi:hypothetical protein